MLIISAINIALNTAVWYYIIAAVVWCTALCFALDGGIAILVNKILPERLFFADNPRFEVSEREKELYKKLKVRLWKDKVWELGGLGGFSKKRLTEPDNPEYLQTLNEIERGGASYRQQAGNFRGFEMRTNPCASALVCWLVNLLCCGGRFFFCC